MNEYHFVFFKKKLFVLVFVKKQNSFGQALLLQFIFFGQIHLLQSKKDLLWLFKKKKKKGIYLLYPIVKAFKECVIL